MPKTLDTAKAKLTIVSRILSPEEISNRIGLRWDDSRRIGAPKGRSDQIWGENIWWLYETSEGQDGVPVERALYECIERLCERVKPVVERIRSLAEAQTVEFGLYMLAQTVPPIHLAPSTLRFVHELGAELDVDIVLYKDDD